MDLTTLQADWEGLAVDDPLWAVFTRPEHRGGRWNPTEFFATGRCEVDDVLDRVRRLHPEARFGAALDFGCGVGRLTRPLADHYTEVVGVDIAPTMVDLARGYHADRPQCRFEVNPSDDLSRFPDGTFDLVLSLIVLQHVPPPAALGYLAEFGRILATDGTLVVQVPATPVEPAPPEPLPAAAFRAGLKIIDYPSTAACGEVLTVTVEVLNDSPVRWPVSAGSPVQVGNHWRATDGSILVNDDGRAPVLYPLAPGQASTVTVDCRVPDVVFGETLRLEVDVVQEGVRWFAGDDSDVAFVDIVVARRAGPAVRYVVGEDPFDRRMHMNGIARDEVEAALGSAGLEVREVSRDQRAGRTWESYLYLATRKALPGHLLRTASGG